jgi:hypothetical protein
MQLTDLGEISGHSPSSFPKYFLEVTMDAISTATFTANVVTFQQTLDGLLSRFRDNTFFPPHCIIRAYLKESEDESAPFCTTPHLKWQLRGSGGISMWTKNGWLQLCI